MAIEVEMVLRLLLAAVLGAMIGYQRARAGKPAGLRDYTLICVGAALFTVASLYGFGGVAVDPSRVAAGIVTGIGFLGAGAIIRREEGVVAGLTTGRYHMGGSRHWSGGRCWFICGISGNRCHCFNSSVTPPSHSMIAGMKD